MKSRQDVLFASLFISASLTMPAVGGINYNDAGANDFSDNRLAPSSLVLGDGSNLIAGDFGPKSATNATLDLDYVTLTVPAGYELHKLMVTFTNVGGAFSFIGIEAGNQVSVPYTTSSAATLLGWEHFGSSSVGLDLLPAMSIASGAQGFSAPLGAGNYTVWLMELNVDEPRGYGFDFQVRAVPEPGVIGLASLAAVALLGRRRQTR